MFIYWYNVNSVSDVMPFALLSVSTTFFLSVVLCLLCTRIRVVLKDRNISSCVVVNPETNWVFEYSTAGNIRIDMMGDRTACDFSFYTRRKRNYKTV